MDDLITMNKNIGVGSKSDTAREKETKALLSCTKGKDAWGLYIKLLVELNRRLWVHDETYDKMAETRDIDPQEEAMESMPLAQPLSSTCA